ncbi:MAG: HlyC/CorC family transporter [Caldisericia bacterium]|nr:HlyC/CorC family transporter [Caldisericia bacterium]
MDSNSLILNFLIIIFLLIISYILSASEISFVGSNEVRLRKRANENDKRAKSILKLKDKPEEFISTIIIANNFVNILAASIANSIFIKNLKIAGTFISSLTMTLIIVIFAELLPKTLSSYNPETFIIRYYPFISSVSYILKPISSSVNYIVSLILKIFGKNLKSRKSLDEEELKIFLSMTTENGTIEEEEKELIESIIEFQDKPVYEVMVPRVDVVLLPVNTEIEKIIETINKTGHSRLPIYEGNIDNIIGILHAKDLLKLIINKNENINIKDLLHQTIFVPDTKKTSELFKEMQKKKIHMAIVVDEFGGFEGIVTMEDLLEEIVGEIQDEYDLEEAPCKKLSDKEFIFDAKITIDDTEEILGIELPHEDYETLGGLFLDLLGHIPVKGESIEYKSLKLIAIEVKGNRIIKIKVEKKDENKKESNPEND